MVAARALPVGIIMRKNRSMSTAKIVEVLRHKLDVVNAAIAAMQRYAQITLGRYADTPRTGEAQGLCPAAHREGD